MSMLDVDKLSPIRHAAWHRIVRAGRQHRQLRHEPRRSDLRSPLRTVFKRLTCRNGYAALQRKNRWVAVDLLTGPQASAGSRSGRPALHRIKCSPLERFHLIRRYVYRSPY